MNTMSHEKRFIAMAQTYDEMAPYCVPGYDFMQDELLKLIPFSNNDNFTLVDLGAGSGRFLEKVCCAFPHVQCYHVDYSDTFQRISQERLKEFSNRITYINSSLEEPWENSIPITVDCIVSMNAIHHLTNDEKNDLYKRVIKKLNARGAFFNSDEIKAIDDAVYLRNMLFWTDHVDEVKKHISNDLFDSYNSWCEHFDKWKDRNITKIHEAKTKADDIHCEVHKQIEWMKQGGLSEVDVYIRYHLWAIFGGYKI